jgi:hypothetical protein
LQPQNVKRGEHRGLGLGSDSRLVKQHPPHRRHAHPGEGGHIRKPFVHLASIQVRMQEMPESCKKSLIVEATHQGIIVSLRQ